MLPNIYIPNEKISYVHKMLVIINKYDIAA